jgi:peptide/nickel transport system substrate-binding protein
MSMSQSDSTPTNASPTPDVNSLDAELMSSPDVQQLLGLDGYDDAGAMPFGGAPSRREFVRRLALAGVGAAALPAFLAACAGSDSGSASDSASSGGGSGGTLTIAMSAANIPFPSTPPDQGYEGYRFVGNNVYDGLTRLNLDQKATLPSPQPALAESWTLSKDKLTWTIKLRKGVKFHDGTAFNADAVIFQFRRMMDLKFQYYAKTDGPRAAANFRFVKSYKKVDDYTISMTTTGKYAWLPYDMLTFYIPSPPAVKKFGDAKYNQNAVGTGPFKITKYVDGETMELTRNDSYWRNPAKLDKIVLFPQPEAASRLSALQSGEVNWAEVPSPDALDQLKGDGYQIFLGKYPHGIMPRFNMFRKPFKGNLKLRQALNYALDRDGCADLINKVGYAAKQYVYEGHPDYDPTNPGYKYDLAKAKSLLAEAGYQPGQLNLKMAYTTGGSGNMFPDVMMQKMKADFTAIGVGLSLQPMEWNTLITLGTIGLQTKDNADIDILWASPAAGMLPTGYNASFYSERPGNIPNAVGLDSPAIDKYLTFASEQFDAAASHLALQKMMHVAVTESDFLFWMHDLNLRVMAPSVKGYVHAQSWWVDFTVISVEGA